MDREMDTFETGKTMDKAWVHVESKPSTVHITGIFNSNKIVRYISYLE